MNLLICGAVTSEIQMLPNAVDLGVGLVHASARLGHILAQQTIHRILFTGTCGATQLPIGTIVRAKTVHLGDLSTLSGDSFMPKLMTTVATAAHFLNPTQDIIESDVFCPLSITKSDTGAALLREKFKNGVVETLEAFAVAQLAVQLKIPYEIILGVSNKIGPSGHQEWLDHHEAVSRATQEWILKEI